MVPGGGIEPTTLSLEGFCSSTELPGHTNMRENSKKYGEVKKLFHKNPLPSSYERKSPNHLYSMRSLPFHKTNELTHKSFGKSNCSAIDRLIEILDDEPLSNMVTFSKIFFGKEKSRVVFFWFTLIFFLLILQPQKSLLLLPQRKILYIIDKSRKSTLILWIYLRKFWEYFMTQKIPLKFSILIRRILTIRNMVLSSIGENLWFFHMNEWSSE